MMNPNNNGKRTDEEDSSPFDGIQKGAVLQEAQAFNDAQIDAPKCCRIMTKILYLLGQGERLSKNEATTLFFSVTKLFQSHDVHLRRLIYLLIKDLKVSSDESLIVISCLNKDMNSRNDLFRANAIRVLAKLIDAPMLGQIDRFLKQGIVDKNPFITCSALVSGLHLFSVGPDIIRRWVSEVQESLNNKSKMVQYHALALLYKIKQNDRLAISRFVTSLVRTPPQSPMGACLLIRYVASMIMTQPNPDQELMKYLGDCLANKSAMVSYEAARTLCRLPHINSSHLSPAIGVLQDYLSSNSPTHRFAAAKSLSLVVTRFPNLVAPCSAELEHLISDSNRSIATLAITTLLKTGVEGNVDRLMKSITGFMSEISDEFKIVLVNAITTLALKFPHKYQSLMAFLASALREEGGASYKKAIVNSILDIINSIPDAKEEGLEHFCEFIEDCEFPDLLIKILQLLGEEGPKTTTPSKFLRFIFNRVILETAAVRAAAVSSLAAFGAKVPSLAPSVVVLLNRCINDNDDEVRDRVAYYLHVLTEKPELTSHLHDDVPVKLIDLEYSLQQYIKVKPRDPFNLQKHLVAVPEDAKESKEEKKSSSHANNVAAASNHTNNAFSVVNPYLEALNAIPEFTALGTLFKSSAPVQLTEEESEYVVSCVKHIYPQHVVLQFNVTNNMEEHLLENVSVEVQPEDDSWSEEMVVPESKLAYGVAGTCFVCLRRPDNAYTSGPLGCVLKFEVKDVDVSSGEVSDDATEDTYQLEGCEVVERDFVNIGAETVGFVEFKKQWEGLGEANEKVKKYSFDVQHLQDAVNAVMNLSGLTASEDSAHVPDDKRSHACNLYGVFLGGTQVLCRAGFMLDQKHGVTLKIAVRCENPEIAALLSS